MRILDRYLARHLIIPILFCSFTLIFLLIIADLFDHLTDLIKNHVSFGIVVQYYINLIPFAFVQTIPWATLLATIYLLVNLNAHNELIAMKVAGLNISKIILPILHIGLLIGICSFLVNDRLVPKTFHNARSILEESIERDSNATATANSILFNLTFFSLNNRLYYAKRFDLRNNVMQDLNILFFDENKRASRRVFAKEARWEGTAWKLINITDYETNSSGKMLGEPRVYSQKVYPEIAESPKEFVDASSESIFLSYRELKHYIQQMQENDLQAYPETVELHYKLSSPWHSLIMMLIVVPFLTVARKKKIIAVNVLYCIALVFAFHVMGAVCLALGKVGTLPPFVSAWSNVLLFSVGSVFFLDRAND